MRLINTDGMAFIGPGSEWFWTAVSGIVLAVTFLGIFRQLRLARSANAFEQLNRFTSEWDPERFARNQLEILVALKDGVMPEHVPDGAAGVIREFWELLGALVRAGHVDRDLVYGTFRGVCRSWWVMLAPHTRRLRETYDEAVGQDFEWLVRVMTEMELKAGVTPFDVEASTLPPGTGDTASAVRNTP